MLLLYSSIAESFGWTRAQIDGEELEFVLGMLAARAKERDEEEGPKRAYINEVF